jgi:hypothetical protein
VVYLRPQSQPPHYPPPSLGYDEAEEEAHLAGGWPLLGGTVQEPEREDPVMLEPVHIDRLLMASDLNDVIFETRPGLNKLMPEVVYINLFSLTLAQPNAEQEPEGD